MKKKKPVIMITIYRRYLELENNLREMLKYFEEKPDVVVVWACPEIGRLWLFQRLQKEGLITHLVYRHALKDEKFDGATTYPESHNIRTGLEFVKKHYDNEKYYVIGKSADTLPHAGTLSFIDNLINNGNEEGEINAVLFHWNNGISHSGVWHTNFYAIPIDEKYWPPLSPSPAHQDCLERQWGIILEEIKPAGIFKGNNNNDRRFFHNHDSEKNPAYPFIPQHDVGSLPLIVKGYRRWQDWIKYIFRCIFFRRNKNVND